ncbi:hypothetical protein AWC29_10780 [Mycobacterium triplex]|uniref:Uncharacterized protein n=1 Tax=Mycobacterium triplex TaxID=47839 RepID=A0A024JQF3_9MYCO|nr:hypothetical protein [Mycobacterium triplex]ORX05338.1 hypothetical protein AWC29_10780 [Mycobacterium triplex]CDO85779.1 hypothetical protein BN973_00112 [Mycobacterium triplex]
MKLVAESGLWTLGPATAATPLAAVLEVSGAVLSWTIDDPPGEERTQITFTDLSRADWLWRVFGEAGHVALAAAADSADAGIERSDVDIVPGSVDRLRRLAVGHWLRRWWPASQRDGIAGLDRALLDVEVAVLTAGAQDFFTDDTLDSDVTGLLAPHAAALFTHVRSDDARIANLVRAGAELADEVGVDDDAWSELIAALDDSGVVLTIPNGRRDDYALAAGADAGPRGSSIARGVASINWTAVPPAIFDAGENTVDWSIEAFGALIRAAIIGPDLPSGIAVRLQSGAISGAGVLDGEGRATLPLVDADGQPMTESAAWDHDWTATAVLVGADTTETRETRDRIRRWAHARLDRPPADAFLAEILASESAY